MLGFAISKRVAIEEQQRNAANEDAKIDQRNRTTCIGIETVNYYIGNSNILYFKCNIEHLVVSFSSN